MTDPDTPSQVQAGLARFLRYVRFDPTTGCVEWIGGTTSGQGKTARYGSFWYAGKSWRAHVWAARFIHGQDVPRGWQVDHQCRNTLCVEHVQAMPANVNRELQWIRVQVGLDEPPEPFERDPDAIPFYIEPEWLR